MENLKGLENERLSMAEFYQKYCHIQMEDGKRKPALRDANMEFFNMVEKAQKEGKQLLMNRNRNIDWVAYVTSLIRTAMQLTDGNKICLLSQKPDKFIADLKQFFNIDVSVEPSKVKGEIQQHSNIITLKSSYFKILDKDGIEMPDHYSGRRRTYEEAKKMVDSLNKNGEFRPYTMVEV